MRRFLFLSFFLFFALPLLASEITLKNKLAEAKPGHYLVTEQNKIYTLLHIFNRGEEYIIFEEVSVPAARFAAEQKSWSSWLESGAPGHTSWIHFQINLATGTCDEIYSFTDLGWIDTTESNRFLSTLLNLNFHEIPEVKRRRVGPPPGYNKPDCRPLWNPRLTVEGKSYCNVPFSAWKARWPNDRSELSGKIIEVYLPTKDLSDSLPPYPLYFPFWLEVEGKIGVAKIRVVDSGTGLHSPKDFSPRNPCYRQFSRTCNN